MVLTLDCAGKWRLSMDSWENSLTVENGILAGLAKKIPQILRFFTAAGTRLDRVSPGHAFLGTTNLDLTSLTERFQTRFQSVRLQPPDNKSLATFLARRRGAPPADSPITRRIAEGAKGNAGAALADSGMWMG